MAEDRQARLAPILLVEDQPNDVWLMQRAFERAGVRHPLIVASNGEEAIEMLSGDGKGGRPCLLITDIEMPRVDGLELLRWLKHRPQFKDMPRLVVSSSGFEENATRALRLGAVACYLKPGSHTGLMKLVMQWKEMFGLNAA